MFRNFLRYFFNQQPSFLYFKLLVDIIIFWNKLLLIERFSRILLKFTETQIFPPLQ